MTKKMKKLSTNIAGTQMKRFSSMCHSYPYMLGTLEESSERVKQITWDWFPLVIMKEMLPIQSLLLLIYVTLVKTM